MASLNLVNPDTSANSTAASNRNEFGKLSSESFFTAVRAMQSGKYAASISKYFTCDALRRRANVDIRTTFFLPVFIGASQAVQ
jgi:hypothetical protein